jgi:hypothetical protein
MALVRLLDSISTTNTVQDARVAANWVNGRHLLWIGLRR